MRIMFLFCLMLLFAMTINSQTYNSLVVNQNSGIKTTILTNEIDSITYESMNRQIVWTKDSIYQTEISVIDSTTFEKVELPDVFVKTDDIGKWSEMRIHKDGSLIALKKHSSQDTPAEGCIIMPNETLGVLYSTFKIDESEVPQYITINDCVILVDNYYDNYVDITVAYNDSILYSLDSIPYNRILTRAWSENNWQRNLTGIIELASGAGSIVGGALLITGSVISETGSLGASTPISIPGILTGSATIAGGISSFNTGWKKLFISGSSQSNIGETIYYQSAGELIANGPQNAYIPEQYFSYMKDPNYSSQLGKAGWINFWVGLTSGLFDNLFGRTVTWDDIRNYYQRKVITGLSKDITTNTATILGYISPDITKSLLNGSKIENEYGVVLCSTKDETERYIQKEINGNGGTIEYDFYNLKPGTPYNYRVYYIDKTNEVNLLGNTKTFKTLEPKVYISDFKVIHSQYSENGFINGDDCYSYKFFCATSIRLNDDNEVDDWGYVYRDPQGNDTLISLKSFGSSYTDTRYAYYRNCPTSSVTLFGYIKYKDNDKIFYEEPNIFELKYNYTSMCPDNNHPHWIDLGLPSGRKWRCCNEGASSPEEFGEYYTESILAWKNQFQELIDCCNHVWDGKGVIFIGPNGGKIYLPAAGWYCGNEYRDYIKPAFGDPIRPVGQYWIGNTNVSGSHYYFSIKPGLVMGFGLYGRSHNSQGRMSVRRCQD